MAQLVSLRTLLDDTGESAATLQHWCNLNVLFPVEETEKRGRGRHRQFLAEPDFGERKWALIASAMNRLKIPVGDMGLAIHVLRRMADPQSPMYWFHGEENEPGENLRLSRYRASPIGRALNKEDQACLILNIDRRDGKPGVYWCGLDLVVRPEQVANEDWLKTPAGFMSKHPSSYVLNLSAILSPLWS